MSIVRVIARLPHYPGKLVRDLRARGFDVQTRIAGGLDGSAADMEISVEHCAPEELAKLISTAAGEESICMLLEPFPNADGMRVLRVFLSTKDDGVHTQVHTPLPKAVVEICTALLNKPDGAKVSSSAHLRPMPVQVPRPPWSSRLATLDWRMKSAFIAALLLISGVLYLAVRPRGYSEGTSGGKAVVDEKAQGVTSQSESVQNNLTDAVLTTTPKSSPARRPGDDELSPWRTRSAHWEVRDFGPDVTMRRLKESGTSRVMPNNQNLKARVVQN